MQLRVILLALPNYVDPLYSTPANSKWCPSMNKNHIQLHQHESEDELPVYTIMGLVDVKESILRTTGNWNEKYKPKNAKLDIALGPPTDPTLLNAFNKNLKSIQKIEENVLSFFPRSSHASPNHSC